MFDYFNHIFRGPFIDYVCKCLKRWLFFISELRLDFYLLDYSQELHMSSINHVLSDFINYVGNNEIGNVVNSNFLGLDLGTSRTRIYSPELGLIRDEASVVAYINENGVRVPYLFGTKAKEMFGKTPVRIDVISPISNGAIVDFEMAEEMVRFFVGDVMKNKIITRPKIITTFSMDLSLSEKKILQETIERCGCAEVFFIDHVMSSAIGCGMPTQDSIGSVIVDIGGGRTDVAIIALGGIIVGKSKRFGGDEIDKSILEYLRNKYDLIIGAHYAEEIKIQFANVYVDPSDINDHSEFVVYGRDIGSGAPKSVTITSKDIAIAISKIVYEIVLLIKKVIDLSPSELSLDINQSGIMLSGGSSMVKNLDKLISNALNLPVFVLPNPEHASIRGLSTIINNFSVYQEILKKGI